MSDDIGTGQLTPKQSLGIIALARNNTNREAAAEIGVHEDTVSRWRQDANFVAALARAQRPAQQRLTTMIVDRHLKLYQTALDELERLVNEGESDSVRARAAASILNALPRLLEVVAIDELEERLEALEAQEVIECQ